MNKVCLKCNIEKDIFSFYIKDGKPINQCKDCIKTKQKKYRETKDKELLKEYFKEYQIENKDKLKEYKKKHYILNKEKIKQSSKNYYENNKDKCSKKNSENTKKNRNRINYLNRIRNKNKRENDPLFRLSNNLRTNIYTSIKRMGYKKESSTYNILGCSYEDFIKHIESRFEFWMNWDNYGRYNGEFNYGWDIDHIIPVSSAKTKEEVMMINHFTNLQPLCSKINRDIKKNKIQYEV